MWSHRYVPVPLSSITLREAQKSSETNSEGSINSDVSLIVRANFTISFRWGFGGQIQEERSMIQGGLDVWEHLVYPRDRWVITIRIGTHAVRFTNIISGELHPRNAAKTR